MNLEEKLKIIEGKIEKGEVPLNTEESTILKYYPGLKNKHVKSCSHNIDLITIENVDGIIEVLLQYQETDLTKSELEQLWYNVVYFIFFVRGNYSYGVVDEILSSVNLSEETKKNIISLEARYLSEEGVSTANIYCTEELLNFFLDRKCYYIISKIEKDNYSFTPSDEILDRIDREFPKDKYSLPKFLVRKKTNSEVKSKIEIISKLASTSLDLISTIYSGNFGRDGDLLVYANKLKIELGQKVFDAFSKMDDLYEYCLWERSTEFTYLKNIHSALNREDQKRFELMCFEKNCFDYIWSLCINDVINKDQLEQKVRELMAEDMDIPDAFFSQVDSKFIKNPEFIDYLIKKGNIPNLIRFNSPIIDAFDESFTKSNINKIVEQIRNGNPNYEKYITNVTIEYHSYPEILEAIIKTGRVEKITTNAFDEKPVFKKLINDLFVYNPNVKVEIAFMSTTNPFVDLFVENLLKHNQAEKAARYIMNVLSNSDYTDLVSKYLSNYYIAEYLINHANGDILKNKELTKCYFKDELLVEMLLTVINHEENYYSFYNHENFEQIKNILARKYKLNLKHLELMEQTFGPLIIRYIENDNIHSIINLNEENFQKFILLFPKQSFEMVDIEAAYDSLIQNMFAKLNPNVVTIYGLFIQALDQNDQVKINEIKETLAINTSPKFIASLLAKYKLPNFEDANEFISYLIDKYPSNKEEIKKIIHEITTEYILTKRKDFHNNHYLEETHPSEYHIFDILVKAIDSNDKAKIVQIELELEDYLGRGFIKRFTKDKDIPNDLTPLNLLDMIINKIKIPEKRIKYLSLLKEITDYYISRKMEERKNELAMGAELGLPYDLDQKNAENEIIKYIITNSTDFSIKNSQGEKEYLYCVLIERLKQEGISSDLTQKCLQYYKDPSIELSDLNIVKETLKKVIVIATKLIREKEDDLYYGVEFIPRGKEELLEKLDRNNKIRRIYKPSEEKVDIYQILCELNIELMKSTIFSKEEIYEKIKTILQKRKIFSLPENFKKLIEKCNISSDYSNLAGFISFFEHILDEEQKLLSASGKDPSKALSSLAIILSRAETYSGISSVYTQILGAEDAKLIKSNPGPNSACEKIKNNQRLNEAIELTKKCFIRQEITIPTFDKDFEFDSSSGKKKRINIIVGNFTSPCNLTHGERTGACMRIGGVGESLFNFCLTNPNGFHIRFEDPETHEYISRVSGFRNGNTVFLNELRYSCNKQKFSDDDVAIACKFAAEELIELSKDSECPIENVVIANQYAITNSRKKMEQVDLKVRNIKEGLPGFYSDVGSKAVVLATTSKDAEFVPVKMNKSKVPIYLPCRGKIERISDKNILLSKINRVKSIKALIDGIDFEDIDQFQFSNGVVYGIVADDWYIYIDRNMEISYDYIDVDPRAKKELATNLQIIEEMIKRNEIEAKDDEYVL